MKIGQTGIVFVKNEGMIKLHQKCLEFLEFPEVHDEVTVIQNRRSELELEGPVVSMYLGTVSLVSPLAMSERNVPI